MKCAFIISPSYSGSTLLSMLLAHHPELSTLGEFLDAKKRRYREGQGDYCSCGATLADCQYMEKLTEKVKAKGLEFSVDFPDTAFYGEGMLSSKILESYIRRPAFESLRSAAISVLPNTRRIIRKVAGRNSAVISSILELDGTSVYLDSAKNNNRVVFFDRYAPDIDVKVIWLIRDGRGVVNSIMKHYEVDIDTAVKMWMTVQESVIRTTRMIPTRNLLKMRYEDLCSEPKESLTKVCQHLALDPESLPEKFGDMELHLTGNNMRLNGLSEIRIDHKWKDNLDEGQLSCFNEIGGNLNNRLGY